MTYQFKYKPRGKAAIACAAALSPLGEISPDYEAPRAIPSKPEASPVLILPASLQARYSGLKARKSGFQPSAQQQAYFTWIENGSGSAILRACAGAGKSTTLIQGLPYMEGNIFLGAFGKDAAADIQAKAHKAGADRQGIRMSTMHSAGFAQFRGMFSRDHKMNVTDRKVGQIIDDFAHGNPKKESILASKSFISRMVSYGKQSLIGCKGYPAEDNFQEWLRICDHFSADQDLPDSLKTEDAIEWVINAFALSRHQCEHIIDFDDMLYAPIFFGARGFPNDWILVDEAQDCNAARIEMASRMLKSNGRAVFVGDDRQAIFGFTGAGSNSLDIIASRFECAEMPLSVTYRCPKAVVAYVKATIDPEYQIEAHPSAMAGEVRFVKYKESGQCRECNGMETKFRIHHPDEFPPGMGVISPISQHYPCQTCHGARVIPASPWFIQDAPEKEDAILCRYTKPLIACAYAVIREGIACKVEGRDIGNGLINLARMWRITSIARLKERLDGYLAREIAKARQKQSAKREQDVEDRVGSLRMFIERCEAMGKSQISDLIEEIQSLFADGVSGMVRLSTGHKFKGREAGRVFWLQCNQRMQMRKVWEAEAERNVAIVIATRVLGDEKIGAKGELILVPETIHTKQERKK